MTINAAGVITWLFPCSSWISATRVTPRRQHFRGAYNARRAHRVNRRDGGAVAHRLRDRARPARV